MAIEKPEKPARKSRIDLGDVTPPEALATATEGKEYYSVRIPKPLYSALRQAQAREGHRQGHTHFAEVMTAYLKKNHPDLI